MKKKTPVKFFVVSEMIFLFASLPVMAAQSGKKKSAPIAPPVYDSLPRTKAGLKRFLMTQCVNNGGRTARQERTSNAPKGESPFCRSRIHYHECLASAEKNTKPCEDLSRSCGKGAAKVISVCEGHYYMDAVVASAVTDSPEEVPLCLKSMPQRIPRSKRESACMTMMRGIKDGKSAAGLCRAFPGSKRDCESNFTFLSGPRACARLSREYAGEVQNCEDMVAIRQSSGKLVNCGHSPVCRAVFSGSRNDCAPLLEVANQDYCLGTVTGQFRGMLHQEAQFRKYNHLPPYKDGDKFLDFLSPQEKEKYYNKKTMRANDRKYFAPNGGRPPKNMPPPPGASEQGDAGGE